MPAEVVAAQAEEADEVTAGGAEGRWRWRMVVEAAECRPAAAGMEMAAGMEGGGEEGDGGQDPVAPEADPAPRRADLVRGDLAAVLALRSLRRRRQGRDGDGGNGAELVVMVAVAAGRRRQHGGGSVATAEEVEYLRMATVRWLGVRQQRLRWR
ncbi:hypothetical protein OsJ_07713 [Oryza sativa Japonica Group]|nr:hypothetical protein OsJ_07713 [Oryza sativa Japonica Group]